MDLIRSQSIDIIMVDTATKKLTKAEFWALADAADITYELIDGIAVPKMSPKYFHARSARRILNILEAWAKNRGRAEMEWAFDLGEDSTPVPNLIYRRAGGKPLASAMGMNAVAALAAVKRCHGFSLMVG